jgi:hypothetical protein
MASTHPCLETGSSAFCASGASIENRVRGLNHAVLSHEEFGSWIDGESLEQRLQFGPQNLSLSHAIFGVPRKF